MKTRLANQLLTPRLYAIAILPLLSSCEGVPPFCQLGANPSLETIVDIAVNAIVHESQSPVFRDGNEYISPSDFYKRNPNCCYVQDKSVKKNDKNVSMLSGYIDIVIVYTRNGREHPQKVARHVSINACSGEEDHTELRLRDDPGGLDERRWGWIIK